MIYLKEPEVLVELGARIKHFRREKNMTQEELADKANIAVSQVGRIERGKINPSISTVFVISLALEMEMQDLVNFKGALKKRKVQKKSLQDDVRYPVANPFVLN